MAPPIRVLVCGSRSWGGYHAGKPWTPTPEQRVEARSLTGFLNELLSAGDPLLVVHGACPDGADSLAAGWAAKHAVPVEEHPADWAAACRPELCKPGHRRRRPDGTEYCPAAGMYRNADMVGSLDPARDVVVAAWDGQSKGTSHTVSCALKAGVRKILYIQLNQPAYNIVKDPDR